MTTFFGTYPHGLYLICLRFGEIKGFSHWICGEKGFSLEELLWHLFPDGLFPVEILESA